MGRKSRDGTHRSGLVPPRGCWWVGGMMKRVSTILAVLIAGSVLPSTLQGSESILKAKALFKRYVDLEHAFDPAVADLYADGAVIRNKRRYPTGQARELSMPAPQYKALIRQAMPLAKARGDRNTYTDCKYTDIGERVRIVCSRYSELKKYTSPLSMLVGPDASGHWLIFEELSESQP